MGLNSLNFGEKYFSEVANGSIQAEHIERVFVGTLVNIGTSLASFVLPEPASTFAGPMASEILNIMRTQMRKSAIENNCPHYQAWWDEYVRLFNELSYWRQYSPSVR